MQKEVPFARLHDWTLWKVRKTAQMELKWSEVLQAKSAPKNPIFEANFFKGVRACTTWSTTIFKYSMCCSNLKDRTSMTLQTFSAFWRLLFTVFFKHFENYGIYWVFFFCIWNFFDKVYVTLLMHSFFFYK